MAYSGYRSGYAGAEESPGSITPSGYTAGYAGGYAETGLARITSARVTSWSIASTLTPVTSIRGTTWAVASTSALVRVTSTRAGVWSVAATALVVRVTSTRAAGWDVGSTATVGQVTSQRSTAFAVRSTVGNSRASQWAVFAFPTSATVVPMMRLRIHAANGADFGPLPVPQGVNASYVMNDVGGLQFSYAPIAPKAELLGQPCEVAVEVSPDSGKTWFEPPNSRFLYLADGRDPISRTDLYSIDAKSYAWRFSKARVLPGNFLNADGKRAFNGVTPGTLLKTLFNEAQARGALSGVSHATFSTTTDSAGVAWAKTLSIAYEPGLDYLAILQNLADQGFIDFRTQGRSIQVFNADGPMAVDRTVGNSQVIFRAGRDLKDAPFRRTWEGLANYAYFAGDGVSYEFLDGTASAPWGRWETFISNGSVSDQGTMAALTQTELGLSNRERIEYTRGLDFSRALSRPHWDYGVGDYVWSAVDGQAPERLRVRQLTLTNDERNILSGNVVLNDRFLEADIRAKRRIEGITNGAAGGPGTGGPGDPDNSNDNTTPMPPTGLTGTSSAYLGPGGFAQSQVTLSWAGPTTNTDSTTLDDLDHYEVFERPLSSPPGSQKHVGTVTDEGTDRSPYVPGTAWLFSVRAVDTSGHRSAFSGEVQVTMAQDITPPVAPSTPTITASLGILRVRWDGLPSTGTEWLRDFDHVEVHASTTNNFTPGDGTIVDNLFAEGVAVLTGYTYGTPVYVKLIAVDKAGLKSPPSVQATGTPSRLVGSDVDPGAIGYEQIAFKDPGNVVADGSFETPIQRFNLSSRMNSAWSFTTDDAFHGTYSATINAATGAGTSRTIQIMTAAEARQILEGDAVFARFAYKGTVGANGSLRLAIQWISSTGTTTQVTVEAVARDNTWRAAAAKHTAPAGTVSFRTYLELNTTANVGTFWVDAIEIRPVVGTEIIQDAAITNALIDNLAVNNAKIADLEIGKVTAGTMTADVLVAGRFRTSTSGNRVEFDGTGIRMYRGTSLTGHWNPVPGQLRIYNTTDASHTSTGHGLQFGDETGPNLIVDNNEIMARNAGGYSELLLNREGGTILLGGIMGGLAGDGSRIFPKTINHLISLRGHVLISNTNDTSNIDDFPPLMIGRAGGAHLFMDSNEIGAGTGIGNGPLYLNHIGADGTGSGGTGYHAEPVMVGSNAIGLRRHGSFTAGDRGGLIFAGDTTQNVGLRLTAEGVRAVQGNTNSGLVNMIALDFLQTSERRVKKDVEEFDPIPMVKAARGRRWKYDDALERADVTHFGPMVEDLPSAACRPVGRNRERRDDGGVVDEIGESVGVGVGSMIGIVWEALRLVIERVEELEQRGPGGPVSPPAPDRGNP